MLHLNNQIELELDNECSTLKLNYQPLTDHTLYDVCDVQGRILKTGEITSNQTNVDLKGLDNDQYILLVLDGNRAYTRKIKLKE